MKALRLLLPALLALLSLGLAAPAHASDTYVAPLSGNAEIPARDTLSRGVAVIHVADDALHYRLIVANIDNVVAAHIHTIDGVSPTNTGPGDFPGGEIRGQLG